MSNEGLSTGGFRIPGTILFTYNLRFCSISDWLLAHGHHPHGFLYVHAKSLLTFSPLEILGKKLCNKGLFSSD